MAAALPIAWPAGARAFVGEARVARLATSAADNTPHVIPICYAVIGDSIYSVVDAKPKRNAARLKRLRNIEQNPSVAIVVDRYDDDWSRLAWVLLHGRADLVVDQREYEDALAGLRERYPQYRSMSFAMAANPMIRIELERVTAWAHGPDAV